MRRGGPRNRKKVCRIGWRSVKYEEVNLKEYADVPQTYRDLGAYFDRYNHERLRQSLGYRAPADVHFGRDLPKAG